LHWRPENHFINCSVQFRPNGTFNCLAVVTVFGYTRRILNPYTFFDDQFLIAVSIDILGDDSLRVQIRLFRLHAAPIELPFNVRERQPAIDGGAGLLPVRGNHFSIIFFEQACKRRLKSATRAG